MQLFPRLSSEKMDVSKNTISGQLPLSDLLTAIGKVSRNLEMYLILQ